MHADVERVLCGVRDRLIAEHCADVAGAIDMLDAAREAIEEARATLEAAEALALFVAYDVNDASLDLGTDRLVAAMIAVGQLARI